MNKIFKVIYNVSMQRFIVVSELSKSKGKSSSKIDKRPDLSLPLSLVGGLLLSTNAFSASQVSPNQFYAETDSANSFVAVGKTAIKQNTGSGVSIGSNTSVNLPNGIAIGQNVSVGLQSTLDNSWQLLGRESTALGQNVTLAMNRSVAIGTDILVGRPDFPGLTTADYITESVAVGSSLYTPAKQVTMMGTNVSVLGMNSVGIGTNLYVGQNSLPGYSTESVVLGNHISTSERSYAIGSAITATATDAISIGREITNKAPTRSIAIGKGINITSGSSEVIAIGTNAKSYGGRSIAIGMDAGIMGGYSNMIAIGSNARANLGAGAMAFGLNANASNEGSVAIGRNAFAQNNNSLALGNSANATSSSLAIGNGARSSSVAGVSIGTNACVTNAENGIAIGKTAIVEGANTVALGSDISVSTAGSVVLGNASASSTAETVSDATVGSYVYSADRFAGKDFTNRAGAYVSVGSTSNPRQIKFVGAGQISKNSTDAINGSQLYAVMERAETGWNITTSKSGNGEVSGTIDDNIGLAEILTVDANNNINITQSANKISIATSSKPTFEIVNVTNSLNVGDIIVNASGINMTNKPITNLQAGTNDTDAVNVSQLKKARSVVRSGTNTVVLTEANTTSGGTDYIVHAFNTTVSKGSDEVKVEGTFNTATNTTNYAIDLSDSAKNNITTANEVANAANNTANAGWKLNTTSSGNGQVSGSSNETINMNETVTIDAGNNINITQATNKITIATSTKPTFETVNLTKDGNTVNFTPSSEGLTLSNATGQPVKVSGVANGTVSSTSKDAINGSQLYETQNTLTAKGLSFLGNDNGLTAIHKNLGDTLSIVGGVDKAQKDSTTAKNTYVDNEDGKLVVKFRETPEFKGVTFNTSGTIVNLTTTAEGLKVADKDGNVTKITNVANGTVSPTSNDAINGSQLYATEKALTAKGLSFLGNDNGLTAIHKNLGDTLSIVGGASNETTSNINTYVDNSGTQLIVKIKENPEFKGVTFNTSGTIVNLTTTAEGLKVADKDGNATKITNVANGTISSTSNDAINGSQLYATEKALTAKGLSFLGNDNGLTAIHKNLGDTLSIVGGASNETTSNINTYVDNSGTQLIVKIKENPEFTGVTFNTSGTIVNLTTTEEGLKVADKDGNATKITNLKAGEADTDAVNVSQLKNATSNMVATGLNFAGDNNVTVHRDLGQTLKIEGGATSNLTYGNIGVVEDPANGSLSVRLAEKINLGTNGTITMGNTTLADNQIKVGDNTTIGNGTATFGNVTIANDKISGLRDGDISANSTEAINGSQLFRVVNNISNVASDVAKGWNLTTTASGGFVENTSLEQINMGETVKIDAGKNVNITQAGNTVSIAVSNNPTFENVTTDNLIFAGNPNAKMNYADGGISLNGNKLTNVANGTNPTDAVNVQQLNNAGWTIAGNGNNVSKVVNNNVVSFDNGNGTTARVVKKDDGSTAVSYDVNRSPIITNSDGTLVAGNKSGFATADDIANAINQAGWQVQSTATVGTTGKVVNLDSNGNRTANQAATKVSVGNTVNVNAGNNIVVTRQGRNIEVATSMTPTFNTVAVGNGEVTIGASKGKDGVSQVTLAGKDGKSAARISNVAAGKADTDAVNVSQLRNTANILNNNINAVNDRVTKVDRRLRAGVAGALAVGNLPQVHTNGKSQLAAGVGSYRGQNAVAVGYSRLSDNGKVILKVSGNADSRGDVGGAASIGFEW
ncbi:hypothetical protein B0187_01590 [Haemophilus paracuniculus]|uniref:Adhesin n=1 Tax=Haemophilus paracuniculus TaxID=734 RepID=A0A1T0AV73_9PAST|nr:YadA-like family protein [Haemophilus paracuniculus]OOS00621.1 hypothetical protein B0187_01590 [Haemophilus paracuniculus]